MKSKRSLKKTRKRAENFMKSYNEEEILIQREKSRNVLKMKCMFSNVYVKGALKVFSHIFHHIPPQLTLNTQKRLEVQEEANKYLQE